MLAVRWHGRGDVRVEEVADPGSPPAGWLRLKVLACGICGTDVEEYVAGPTAVSTEPNRLTGVSAPLVLGHETVGVVTDVGDGVTIPVGAHVAVEGTVSCGACLWCRSGSVNLCVDVAWLGLRGHGGLAEVMLTPAASCVQFEPEDDPRLMALSEPLSVAVRAVRRGGLTAGATVGVVGCGTVGLLAVQVARAAGASYVVAVEPQEGRRALATRLGADLALEPDDAAVAIAEATDGIGLDVVLEVTGVANGIQNAARVTRRGGTTVALGVFPPGPVPMDLTEFVLGEKRLVASLSHTVDEDFAVAVDLLVNGQVQVAELVTDRIALCNVVTSGLDALVNAPQDHLKILVSPA